MIRNYFIFIVIYMSKSKQSNIKTNKNTIKIIINNDTKKRKRKNKKYDGKSKHHTAMGQPVQPGSQAVVTSSGLVKVPRGVTVGSARLPDDLSALSLDYLKPATVKVTPKDVETPIAPVPSKEELVKQLKDATTSEKQSLMKLKTQQLKQAIRAAHPHFPSSLLNTINQRNRESFIDDLFGGGGGGGGGGDSRAPRRFSDIDDEDDDENASPQIRVVPKSSVKFTSQQPFNTGSVLSRVENATATSSGAGALDIFNDESWMRTDDDNEPPNAPAPNVTVRPKQVDPPSPQFNMDLSEVPPATRASRRESFLPPDQSATTVPVVSQREILKQKVAERREKKMIDQTASTQPIEPAKERTATPIKAKRVAGTLTLNDDDIQSVTLSPAQESKALKEFERKQAREQSDLISQVLSQPMSGPSKGYNQKQDVSEEAFMHINKITVPVDLSKAEKISAHPFASLVRRPSSPIPQRRPSATASGLPVPPQVKKGVGRPKKSSTIASLEFG